MRRHVFTAHQLKLKKQVKENRLIERGGVLYLETGALVEADDSEDDKACSNGERKSDHGKLAVVSCEEPGTMAIDVH